MKLWCFLGIQFGFALQNAERKPNFETLGRKGRGYPRSCGLLHPLPDLILQPIDWPTWAIRRGIVLDDGGLLHGRGYLYHVSALLHAQPLPRCGLPRGCSGSWIASHQYIAWSHSGHLLATTCLPSRRTMGFAMQSFFIGTGAVVASALLIFWPTGLVFPILPRRELSRNRWSCRFTLVGWCFFLSGLLYRFYFQRVLARWVGSFLKRPRRQRTGIKMAARSPVTAPPVFQAGVIWTLVGLAATLLIAFTGLAPKTGNSISWGDYCLPLVLSCSCRGYHGENDQAERTGGDYERPCLHMLGRWGSWPSCSSFLGLPFYAMWIYTTPRYHPHIYGTTDSTIVLIVIGKKKEACNYWYKGLTKIGLLG